LRGFQRNAHVAQIMVHDKQPIDSVPPGQGRGGAPGGERVAKALARAGVASRREVERLIEAGRVALNGKVLTTPAVKVEPGDILTVDGAVVNDAEPARLFRYHKPAGLVTSHKDPQGRPTVFAALPPGLPRLISVGRLDLNSEGLLLLTNDGGLARALELPTTGLVRHYRARAHGRVTQERLDTLKAGVVVEGVSYGPIEARLDKAKDGPQGANLWISVTLAEGKNREVRRVLESLGLKVNRLIRLAYGPFALGTLEVGAVEEVGPRVIREQLASHIAPQNLPKGDRPQFTGVAVARTAREAGDGSARRRGSPASQPRTKDASGEPRKKTEYKAGWAKPKSRKVIVARAGKKPRSSKPTARPGVRRDPT
jgi:23S rRNA pseudouridine2605 synthase